MLTDEPRVVVADPRQGTGAAAVHVRGLSKAFSVPRHRAWTIKERLRHPIASFGHDRFEALHDISFDVAPGEFFAVIGRNGCGKSTLLRCIAGIHEPDAGEVDVRGRLAPFIELGVGFHPMLNAPDNVTLAGTLMGLRPADARSRFPRVISFAELEEFVELPIANYSSGMALRLAFSTSFQVDADVLLFDEVLAVGDELFQRKCLETFERLIAEGRTIVYVSHNLETVRQFADRVLLLDHGCAIEIGAPDEVIEVYQRRNRERQRSHGLRPGGPRGWGEIVDVWLQSGDGERTSAVARGEDARFSFVLRPNREMERPVMGFALRDSDDNIVLSETDSWRRRTRELVRAGEPLTFSADFPRRLDPGDYQASALLASPGETGMVEARERSVRVRVREEPRRGAWGAPALAPGDSEHDARRLRLRRFSDVTLVLARAEFKLRYLDSAIGYVWALVQPLLMYLVLYLIWTRVIHTGTNVSDYRLKLLLGLALFTFFTEATGHALPALVTKGSMLRKVPFPPLAVPLSSVLTSAFVYGLSLIIVVGFILFSGISPTAAWLEMIPLLALLVVFTVGVGLALSLLYVGLRDIQPIWVVVSRLLFFLTPVFYPVEIASRGLQHVLMLNPLAVVIEQARHVMIDPAAPTAAAAAGGTLLLAVPIVGSIALVVAGILVYRSRARRLVERI